ncbi:MAG: hypothetical protein M5U01_10340 [Ardenticatenaceae bacterium]|nr:hypothetical protein [Ardenticatenaceae bacterium]
MGSRILVAGGTSPGRVLVVDPLGNADYTTIQAAINAANGQSPTAAAQWLILVAPGRYEESLTLYDYVNVAGLAPDKAAFLDATGSPAIATAATCTVSHLRVAGDTAPIVRANVAGKTLRLVNVIMEEDDAEVDGLAISTGTVELYDCHLQAGGPALAISGGTARVSGSLLRHTHGSVLAATEGALEVGGGTVELVRCVLENTAPAGPAVDFTAAPIAAKLLQCILRPVSGANAIDADVAVTAVVAACLGTAGIHANVSGVVSYTEDATI